MLLRFTFKKYLRFFLKNERIYYFHCIKSEKGHCGNSLKHGLGILHNDIKVYASPPYNC